MNIRDAFPSRFLRPEDLKGAEPVVTIDRVAFEVVGRKREKKAIVYFVGKAKGLVLNRTNADALTQLLGSALTEEWQTRRVRLYSTQTTFGRDQVPCIRIKAADRHSETETARAS